MSKSILTYLDESISPLEYQGRGDRLVKAAREHNALIGKHVHNPAIAQTHIDSIRQGFLGRVQLAIRSRFFEETMIALAVLNSKNL